MSFFDDENDNIRRKFQKKEPKTLSFRLFFLEKDKNTEGGKISHFKISNFKG